MREYGNDDSNRTKTRRTTASHDKPFASRRMGGLRHVELAGK